MKIKLFLKKLSIIVAIFLTLTIVSCGGGGGSDDKNDNPNSIVNPIKLGTVSTTVTNVGSVKALGTTYYKFTAGLSDGYEISLVNTHSDLSWTLMDSNLTRIAECDSFSIIENETCSTPVLAQNSAYYVIVDEWDGVSGSFIITIDPLVEPAIPTADAGLDQNVKTGSIVALDGSGSSDPNGDVLTYAWSFSKRPAGSTAVLSSSVDSSPTFTADLDGIYIVELTVSDGTNISTVDTVTITAATYNSAPIANAGKDSFIVAGPSSTLQLDGSASSDADGDPLIYTWSIISKPDASLASLSDVSAVNPNIVADKEGTYVIELKVNDGTVSSPPVEVTIKAYRYIDNLNFRVVDAEYSKYLDNIIFVSSAPSNQLHIYDPVAETDKTVNLNLAPACVSVSPDGMYAAVGHNGWISYVDLSTGTLVKTLPVSTDVLDIVLAGNGYIYAFPRSDQWENIRCVKISDGSETLSTGYFIFAGTRAKLHPDGIAIYGADNGLSPSDIEKYSINGGTASYLYDSPYHGDYPMCGDLWMAEDGLRIFTRCGNVFRASPNQVDDMTYNGALENLGLVKNLNHSQVIGKVAAIPDNGYSISDADTEVRIFNYDYLTFSEKKSLPYFVISSTSAYAGHGRYVFYNSTGSKYFVVVQADSTSGILSDYGIVSY